jgi:putative hydrolase of the HAD superfamily
MLPTLHGCAAFSFGKETALSEDSSSPTTSDSPRPASAILWDFGGVFTSSPFEAFNTLEERVGAPKDFIRQTNAINPDTNAWAKFESNSVSLGEFDVLFANESEARGHRIPGKDVIAMLSGTLRPRMVEVLKLCKQHYKVACITNNVKAGEGPGMARGKSKASAVAEVMAMFDLVVESSVEGVRKPNPEIYRIACDRLGVDCTEAIFLDDLGINLKPAKALGMQTIKVVSQDQAIDDLSALTGLTFA